MLYLLDANVLTTAHQLYYPVDAVPEFWSWLAHKGGNGELKMPLETFEEVRDGGNDAERDLLYAWCNRRPTGRQSCLMRRSKSRWCSASLRSGTHRT